MSRKVNAPTYRMGNGIPFMPEERDKKAIPQSVRFTFLTGDVNWLDYGGKWISQVLNNGEFDFWLVRELVNMEDACGNTSNGKYLCTLSVVSPSEFKDFDAAFRSCGWEDMTPENLSDKDKVEIIHSYSGGSQEWSDYGSNYKKLFQQCKEEAEQILMLFGFYLDRPHNGLGDSGWDRLKGTSILDRIGS